MVMVSSPCLQHNNVNFPSLLIILESMETSTRECANTPYIGLSLFSFSFFKWQRAKARANIVNMRYIIHLADKITLGEVHG